MYMYMYLITYPTLEIVTSLTKNLIYRLQFTYILLHLTRNITL